MSTPEVIVLASAAPPPRCLTGPSVCSGARQGVKGGSNWRNAVRSLAQQRSPGDRRPKWYTNARSSATYYHAGERAGHRPSAGGRGQRHRMDRPGYSGAAPTGDAVARSQVVRHEVVPAVRPRHRVSAQARSRSAFLVVAALGVVYGDIGTSPLYALRECFSGIHAIPVTTENVLGVVSLIFWSLIVTVSIKYLLFVMRSSRWCGRRPGRRHTGCSWPSACSARPFCTATG